MVCSREYLKPWPRSQAVPRLWVTVDELRAWIDELARCRFYDAVPVYLLLRQPEYPTCGHSGNVLIIAGDVRKHVSAAELCEWAVRLERCEMLLQVLCNDDRELVFDDAEHARIDQFLSDQATAQEQMGAEWEVSRRQAQVWREELASERVSWDRNPSNGGQCYDCGYRM